MKKKTDDPDQQGMTRRNFVTASAVAGAGIMLAPLTSFGANRARSKNAARPTIAESKMKTRKLGMLEVSELGSGAMNMSGNYNLPADIPTSIATLRTAYDNGVRLFDTAEVYGMYTNETLVGEALKPFRNKVKIATKFGFDLSGTKPGVQVTSDPKHIKRVVEESLKRLQTDHIDLYYQHRIDPQTPIEDVAGAVQDLIKEGKVLHFGLSEASAKMIRSAHAVQRLTAVQSEYSILERGVEQNGVLKTCEELGIGFVPWGPVGMGYLTGKITPASKFTEKGDLRADFDRFTPANLKANWPIVEMIIRLAKQKNAAPTQIALAWLLAQKPFIVPIPGTRSADHLKENLGALKVQFTKAELAEIDAVVFKNGVHGGRMNAMQMTFVDDSV